MNGVALGGADGFAQDGAGSGFAKPALDLVEVGELAEDPGDEALDWSFASKNFLRTWAWQPIRVMWSLPLAHAG